MRPGQADLVALIAALQDAGVEFIIVGGAAAVLHGAPTTTLDLDIVPSQNEPNIDKLLEVLAELDTIHRDPAGRELRPTREALAGTGQLNLITKFGPLDVLCRLHDGRGYDQLSALSVVMADDDLEVRVIELPTLIEIKANTGRAKDRLIVPILGALLDDDD